jgi:hypothetical protein
MRKEILTFEDYFWGLTKDDFKATSDLIKVFMKAYWNEIKLPKESKIVTPEIDLFIALHYRETQMLLQFGIWRLQSIFESLLKTNFDIQVKGIREKIKDLKVKGFNIIKKSELFKWAELRNKLSHSAPEMLHPCPTNLIESDIDDFSQLLLEIYEDLEMQKANDGQR